jgi:hypothetical protein
MHGIVEYARLAFKRALVVSIATVPKMAVGARSSRPRAIFVLGCEPTIVMTSRKVATKMRAVMG